ERATAVDRGRITVLRGSSISQRPRRLSPFVRRLALDRFDGFSSAHLGDRVRTHPPGFVLLALALWHTIACLGKAADPDRPQDGLPPTRVLDHGEAFRPAALGGRDLILLSLAFSPDGKVIASAGGGNLGVRQGPARGEVKLWGVSTGKAPC